MHRALGHLFALALAYLALAVLHLSVKAVLTCRRHHRQSLALGCEKPHTVPARLPFGIGLIWDVLQADKAKRLPHYLIARFEAAWKDLGRPEGTVRVRSPPCEWRITTSDPKNIQAVLATQFKDFALGENRSGGFAPLLGVGIFTSDGDQWAHSRALLRPQFSRDQVADLSTEERHVQTLIKVIDNHPIDPDTGKTKPIDLLPLFFNLTLDTATEFLFGDSADSQLTLLPDGLKPNDLKPKHPVNIDFAVAFDKSQRIIAFCSRLGPLWWLGHIFCPSLKPLTRQVHEYVDYYVRLALDTPINNNPEDKPRNDTPFNDKLNDERYVFLRALALTTRDPIELRSQLLNVLLAGRDTTASLLGWLFLLLADPQYTTIRLKLRKTILQDFGTFENPRNLTFAELKSCTYLQWCLNEALRLFPVVPINARRAIVDTSLPRGGGPQGDKPIFIPKGTEVVYMVYVMHRRRDIWGEDANVFRPERWAGKRSGWEYLPFNGGPRICIGQQFALTEAGYVTVRLMQRYSEIEGGSSDAARHNLTLTDCPADGVVVRLKVAEEDESEKIVGG
ncbi:cytochrome P450 52A12 [Microthyrium microscopicum]|uniref:Cytochrome P450 52A12 n=1 Tax=Microthyrium microscopicum TaxID=703497 RepID=A0A6A6UHA2_9PEZI|nr:cytochrome P450 52A12 [Microthyrium microscopicum]